MGNSVTMVPAGWATDVDDLVERLSRIHENCAKAKEFSGNSAAAWMPANVVVSNVRGTPVPLDTAGARIECMYPLSVLAESQGLHITVVSYMGRIDVGFTVDPDLVPDAWALAEAIPEALQELLEGCDAGDRRAA